MPRIAATCCLLLIGLLARADAENPPDATGTEPIRETVERLVEQLDSDRFETRQRAADAIEILLEKPELAHSLAIEFSRILTGDGVSFEIRWRLGRWQRRLPKVEAEKVDELSDEQLGRLVRQLDDDAYAVRLGAGQRLKALLQRDENVAKVKRALEARLAEQPNQRPSARVRELFDLTRPAMVAEYWMGGRNLSRQHLLIGVPSQRPGAPRPSHFDRIDNRTAHCVSGTNLRKGNYPVGVAIAHPNQPGALFCLVNLSTPQRRAEYARRVELSDVQRLTALSRRTFDRMLAEKRPLTGPELQMIAQLDPKELSRFAGKHFNQVDDGQPAWPDETGNPQIALTRPELSRFNWICVYLAGKGTKEAMPGLLRALEHAEFLPPTAADPHNYSWVAALAIAVRDPWPQSDAWLADSLDWEDTFVTGRTDGPVVGATAAGMLLKRHGESPGKFGLRAAAEPILSKHGIDGYRFTVPEAQDKVFDWWKQRAADKANGDVADP
ncbi:MAG: hypothetical protein HQ567_24195 [Candidatus Nealsonbacteria bacterium]|nr:hypothetical protein [Candidatus Nealsonbacteria bacterium]